MLGSELHFSRRISLPSTCDMKFSHKCASTEILVVLCGFAVDCGAGGGAAGRAGLGWLSWAGGAGLGWGLGFGEVVG